ncbi:MAG: cell envelope integrity protein CreD [Proteobacteria bacterium]|nr:cell envelope integrity protein CreD [Pseudomonadota bacterium]
MSDPTTPTPSLLSRAGSQRQLWRVILLGGLILLMQVPIFLIANLISDREHTRDRAVRDISSKWGGHQVLVGPLLRVPYIERTTKRHKDGSRHEEEHLLYATFLPESLSLEGQLDGAVRKRGIFEVPTYDASLVLGGEFERPRFTDWRVRAEDILWGQAHLVIHVNDPRGIQNRATLEWNQETLPFEPGTGGFGEHERGIHVALSPEQLGGERFAFRIPLELGGTKHFEVIPVGKGTELRLRSDWADPSFQGAWLPTERTVTEAGFEAVWSVPHLGRNFSQRWLYDKKKDTQLTRNRGLAVDLLTPVDPYRMSIRSVKYELLFLVLTFGAIWLFEVLSTLRVHPLQYLMVGAAMSIFYVLQLSLAEHLGFAWAYGLAATAVSALVTFYGRAFLGDAKRAGIVGGVLAGLYGYLYVVLQLEDHALLFGALGLFGALATVMWVTRRIDWYRLDDARAQTAS